MAKRTLDAFFAPQAKKAKTDTTASKVSTATPSVQEADDKTTHPPATHPSYPHPIAALPDSLHSAITASPATIPDLITDKPDLDLAYYAPFLTPPAAKQLFTLLRSSLPFYRVQYSIKRGPTETRINTPRYTTVFGIDATSTFSSSDSLIPGTILDATSTQPPTKPRYKCTPRPIPTSLDALRRATETATGCTFNICLVNYYASGADSISYHSDDERFLGPDPAIASFSLGARRDFCLRHKPLPALPPADMAPEQREAIEAAARTPMKFPLASGDMLLMRGRTQTCWLHAVPKRKGGEAESGRINITFRKAMVAGGTENYYRYNVGDGGVFCWDQSTRQMRPWKG